MAANGFWPREGEVDTLGSLFLGAVETTGILLPVIGILAVTSEWSQRTALTTFTLVPRRARVIAAKLIAGVVLALIAVLVCLAAAAVAAAASGASFSLRLGSSAEPSTTCSGCWPAWPWASR